MKNQYAGDQNDYVKFGLLRALYGAELRPFVAWMLTPDDDRPDGRRRRYLDDAGRMQVTRVDLDAGNVQFERQQ